MGNAVPEQTFPFWIDFPYWKALTLAYFWRSRCEKTSTGNTFLVARRGGSVSDYNETKDGTRA